MGERPRAPSVERGAPPYAACTTGSRVSRVARVHALISLYITGLTPKRPYTSLQHVPFLLLPRPFRKESAMETGKLFPGNLCTSQRPVPTGPSRVRSLLLAAKVDDAAILT